MHMAPASPAVPAKSMVKVGVWCVVVLFALSIATAVVLDHGSAAPVYDDFVFAAVTTDDPFTRTDGESSPSYSSLGPAWMAAIRADFAGIDPDSLRPSLHRTRFLGIDIGVNAARSIEIEDEVPLMWDLSSYTLKKHSIVSMSKY